MVVVNFVSALNLKSHSLTSGIQALRRKSSAFLPLTPSQVIFSSKALPEKTEPTYKAPLIPPNSLVITIPGMLTSLSIIKPLANYLKAQGNQVYTLEVPYVKWAQRMQSGQVWLSDAIDTIRIAETQTNLRFIQSELHGLKDRDKKIDWIKNFFDLDNSPLASTLSSYIVELLSNESIFSKSIFLLDPSNESLSKPHHERISLLINKEQSIITDLIRDRVSNYANDSEMRANKIANFIFDHIAPRVVLVGHSFGGTVGLKSLQYIKHSTKNSNNDISMLIGIGSPFNGARIPSAFRFLSPFIYSALYGVYQLNPQNGSTSEMQNNPIPFDTTAIGIGSLADGLVPLESSKVNQSSRGVIHLEVIPKQARMSNFGKFPSRSNLFLSFLRKAYDYLGDRGWRLFNGIRHHLGFLDPDNLNFYWSNQGNIYHEIFEGKNTISNLKRLLHPHNNESVQKEVLMRLLQNLDSNPTNTKKLHELVPELERLATLATLALPFTDSSDKLATKVLARINEVSK